MYIHAYTYFGREKELVIIINNCAIPGNGKVAENICYEWTTFQQAPIDVQPTVRNIAYETIGKTGPRADETHYYETISDLTAAQRHTTPRL